MLAYHTNDILLKETSDYELFISQHQNMERKEISLFFDEDLFVNGDDAHENDTNHIDFTMNGTVNLSTNNGATQYLCKVFNNTEDRYVTKLELLDTTNYNLVHHVELLLCPDIGTDNIDDDPKQCGFFAEKGGYNDMGCQLFIALAVG